MTKLKDQRVVAVTLISAILFLSIVGSLQKGSKQVLDSPILVYISGQTYEYHGPIEIDGDEALLAQAASEGWPGTGTPSDPIIISGYFFNVTHVQPVRLWNLELSWELKNNYFTTYGIICGIWLQGGVGGIVTDNVLVECHGGIIIDGQDYLIKDNSITNNTSTGIEIYGTASNLEIRNNIILGVGGDGMKLPRLTDSVVVGNIIHDSAVSGIRLSRTSYLNEIHENDILSNGRSGISCSGQNNTLSGNAIGYNEKGIDLISSTGLDSTSSFNNITQNSIINNTDIGLDIRPDGKYNRISNNDFIDNGNEFQIRDNGTDNEFVNNFYDEWLSPDVDSDGFVDQPYSIDGNANSIDEYPLATPCNPIPEWYEYIPNNPTPSPQFPILETAVALGGGLLVVVVVIVLIRKRG